MMKGTLVLVAFATLAAGCASTAGQPWRGVQVGMTDEALMALPVKPYSVARGDEGATVMTYADGGTVTIAKGTDGEWRVASYSKP